MKSPQKPLLAVTIYQQECHGVEQWRVMRDDGRLFMDCHQVDFDNEEDAVACTWNELRRNHGDCQWRVRVSRHSGRDVFGLPNRTLETLKSPYEVEA